jgi:HEPN domain-containing protein/predicted nucleotidyltransferase
MKGWKVLRVPKKIDAAAQIDRMAKRIAKRFHPQKIILFGSHARGDAGPDSDVDLLVVMPLDGCGFDKADEIRETLDDMVIPKDIIVTSPEDFAWRKEIVSTIEWPATHEGKVLYKATRAVHGCQQAKEWSNMPHPQQLVTAIREWLEKADNDLKNAVHTLTLGKDCPTGTVCFHAQQCIEKYLKALLVFQAIPFGKTHDLDVLMTLLPARRRPRLARNDRRRITKYAAVIRYPLAAKDVSLAQARKEVAIARRVRGEIRRLLPRASLRRNKWNPGVLSYAAEWR